MSSRWLRPISWIGLISGIITLLLSNQSDSNWGVTWTTVCVIWCGILLTFIKSE